MVYKIKVCSNKYRNIIKSGNEIVEILAKNQNLLKFRFENLFISKNYIKFQSFNTIKKLNYLIFNTRVAYSKLR